MANRQVSGVWRVLSIAELGHSILARINSPEDIRNVRLVCKRFNELGTPIVYRSLRICLSKEDFVWSLRFVDYLKERPTYLSMIHELCVNFGSKAFTHTWVRRKTKEFRYRCLVVIDLLHNLPSLRMFRWQTQDTVPEELLDVLDAHPNKPSLDLQQSIYAGHQRFPPFVRITSMSSLKALRVYFDLAAYHPSWIFGLIKGLFEAVNGHLNQLEELQLALQMTSSGTSGDSRTSWNTLRSSNLTESLITHAKESGGCFSALRMLHIQANIPLFTVHENQPLGLYCLLHYTYPALEELRLDFPGVDTLLSQMTRSPMRVRQLYCSLFSNPNWKEVQLALISFLKSLDCLETCSITSTAVQMTDLEPVLAALLATHGHTLSTLEIRASPNANSAGSETSRLYRAIDGFGKALILLSQLGLRFQDPQESRNLIEMTKKLRLEIVSLYATSTGRSSPHIITNDLDGQGSFTTSQGLSRDLSDIASEILCENSTVREVLVYGELEYPASASFSHAIPAFKFNKDLSSNKIICVETSHESQDRILKRLASRLGEQYQRKHTQNADAEKMRMELALFPAYRDTIDAWEADERVLGA